MKSIGVVLKDAREEKGLSINDVAESTKVRQKYIVAIEESDWAKLPGRAYTSGFIKRYAQEVGMDPEKTLAYFRREYNLTQSSGVVPKQMMNEPVGDSTLFLTIKRFITKLLVP